MVIDQRSAILANPAWRPQEYTTARTTPDTREVDLVCAANDMVDYDQMGDVGKAEEYQAKKKHLLDSDDLEALPEDERILLSYFLYGFVLRSRKWGK